VEKGIISYLYQESNPGRPASSFTDWAILASSQTITKIYHLAEQRPYWEANSCAASTALGTTGFFLQG
jgi:hypothetical protein